MNKISDRRMDDIVQEMQQTIATAAGDDENGRGRGMSLGGRGRRVGWEIEDNESKAIPVSSVRPCPES